MSTTKRQKTLNIGGVTLKNRYILAPMAGICDLPFRFLCSHFGAGLTCMEMVSAKAISYENKKTFSMLRTFPGEHPVSLQLFGNDPVLLSEVVKSLEEYPFDIIDINMGCPVPKVVKNGEGSALLKDPLLVGRIMEAMAGATSKPVTAKIRIGFDKDSINGPEIAKVLEASGAAAITVHGRSREQFYEGHANWEEIARVKAAVKIPVIGNGDILTPGDILKMEEQTGVDGFAIARGARGNPWIFREMEKFELTKELPQRPDICEIAKTILWHTDLLIEEKGEYIGIREMRKHAAWYLSGAKNSAKIRGRLFEIQNKEELRDLLALLTEGV